MSHRCSIALLHNDFLTDQPDGKVFATFTDRAYPLDILGVVNADEIRYHRENGFSANCVICRDEARIAHREELEDEWLGRVHALFMELETCDKMARILEIQEALSKYGVKFTNQGEMAREEDKRADDWRDGMAMLSGGHL